MANGPRRRDVIRWMGAGAAAPLWSGIVAGPFSRSQASDHFVPADKKLTDGWIKQLYARGEPQWHSGADLETIGMPVGGIAVGQAYLLGTGQIALWDILNREYNTGYGGANYPKRRKAMDLVVMGQPGFRPGLVHVFLENLATGTKHLLEAKSFRGEYPTATVTYQPVEGTSALAMVVAPCLPLNAEASALPGSVVQLAVTNRSDARLTLRVGLQADLSTFPRPGEDTQRVDRAERESPATYRIVGLEAKVAKPAPDEASPIVFADFEGPVYTGWTVEGRAFGTGPAKGSLPNQQRVSGFEGVSLVNSFLGGNDALTGSLTSPEFTIERPYISLLVGGGSKDVGVRLLVEGAVVATATGKDNERPNIVNWDVSAHKGKRARIVIFDEATGGWGHINVDQIEFRESPRLARTVPAALRPEVGTLCLAVSSASGGGIVQQTPPSASLHSTSLDGPDAPEISASFELEPGETKSARFAIAWHYPNLYRDDVRVGRIYESKFKDSAAVAARLLREREPWASTQLWAQTLYDSTLPYWLLDRIGSTVSILATNTCQWWKNGRFWGWEGVGCCHGTCGHVWNYAFAPARLFPELERSVRTMQDFALGVGLQETGAIGFRGEGWGLWAGDSQGGYVLKAYREHLSSKDDKFLKSVWPQVKKATEFLVAQDGNADGLIEGRQHQTYDQDYFGANTFVGSLYLGALRAAEEMAKLMGDRPFAALCREIFEKGRESSMKLFNGEYFVQDVDLKQHPDWQYADGCLADQMFGQMWAHQVGLGYLYPEEAVKAALRAIWKYNWAPDIAAQNAAHKPERWFAHPGEAGLFTCTWPKSKHLGDKSTRYRDEIWTGIEYQVAAHMVHEGMVDEGLAICRAIHERYDASKRNPWNEIECGDHYARAMASWGVLIAASGFVYDGPAQKLSFSPRVTPEGFRCVFTTAESWGTFDQRRHNDEQVNELLPKFGVLPIRELGLDLPSVGHTVREATLNGRPIPFEVLSSGKYAFASFGQLSLKPGDRLKMVSRRTRRP